jgi:uncharacterized protein YqeY
MLPEINQKILKAIKPGGNKFEAKCLKLLKAELLNNEKTAAPKAELDVTKSYVKKLRKALKAFSNHPERLVLLEDEVKIISMLLPAEVSEERITDVVATVLQNIMTAEKPDKQTLIRNYKGKIIGSTKRVLPDADGGLIAKILIQEINNLKL